MAEDKVPAQHALEELVEEGAWLKANRARFLASGAFSRQYEGRLAAYQKRMQRLGTLLEKDTTGFAQKLGGLYADDGLESISGEPLGEPPVEEPTVPIEAAQAATTPAEAAQSPAQPQITFPEGVTTIAQKARYIIYAFHEAGKVATTADMYAFIGIGKRLGNWLSVPYAMRRAGWLERTKGTYKLTPGGVKALVEEFGGATGRKEAAPALPAAAPTYTKEELLRQNELIKDCHVFDAIFGNGATKPKDLYETLAGRLLPVEVDLAIARNTQFVEVGGDGRYTLNTEGMERLAELSKHAKEGAARVEMETVNVLAAINNGTTGFYDLCVRFEHRLTPAELKSILSDEIYVKKDENERFTLTRGGQSFVVTESARAEKSAGGLEGVVSRSGETNPLYRELNQKVVGALDSSKLVMYVIYVSDVNGRPTAWSQIAKMIPAEKFGTANQKTIDMKRRGWLEGTKSAGKGVYKLTEEGRRAVRLVINERYLHHIVNEPLPLPEAGPVMQQLKTTTEKAKYAAYLLGKDGMPFSTSDIERFGIGVRSTITHVIAELARKKFLAHVEGTQDMYHVLTEKGKTKLMPRLLAGKAKGTARKDLEGTITATVPQEFAGLVEGLPEKFGAPTAILYVLGKAGGTLRLKALLAALPKFPHTNKAAYLDKSMGYVTISDGAVALTEDGRQALANMLAGKKHRAQKPKEPALEELTDAETEIELAQLADGIGECNNAAAIMYVLDAADGSLPRSDINFALSHKFLPAERKPNRKDIRKLQMAIARTVHELKKQGRIAYENGRVVLTPKGTDKVEALYARAEGALPQAREQKTISGTTAKVPKRTERTAESLEAVVQKYNLTIDENLLSGMGATEALRYVLFAFTQANVNEIPLADLKVVMMSKTKKYPSHILYSTHAQGIIAKPKGDGVCRIDEKGKERLRLIVNAESGIRNTDLFPADRTATSIAVGKKLNFGAADFSAHIIQKQGGSKVFKKYYVPRELLGELKEGENPEKKLLEMAMQHSRTPDAIQRYLSGIGVEATTNFISRRAKAFGLEMELPARAERVRRERSHKKDFVEMAGPETTLGINMCDIKTFDNRTNLAIRHGGGIITTEDLTAITGRLPKDLADNESMVVAAMRELFKQRFSNACATFEVCGENRNGRLYLKIREKR